MWIEPNWVVLLDLAGLSWSELDLLKCLQSDAGLPELGPSLRLWLGWLVRLGPFCTGSLILKQAILGLFMWWEKGHEASRGLGSEVAHCHCPHILLVKASDKLAQIQEMGK